MMQNELPHRNAISPEHTWNATSVFESIHAWEAECKLVPDHLSELKKYQGHLSDGPSSLADGLDTLEILMRSVGKIYVYASMSHSVDATDQEGTRMSSKAQAIQGEVLGAIAFIVPEILAIKEETLREWTEAEPRLNYLNHYLADLFRKKAHFRSTEVEQLLGLLSDPFRGTSGTARMLTSADFEFESAVGQDGKKVPVSQGTIYKILSGADREARRTAWENYLNNYLRHKNTLANNLNTSVKQNVFLMKSRNHKSTLEAALFNNAIPVEVFHTLIDTFRKNLPTWHRYWAVRRKALGFETLHPYDIWAPLTREPIQVSYEQAVDWICEGLSPLGEDYVGVMREGCHENRWVDIYPNKGKSSGAFSTGRPGTHPFIMMSYNKTIFSLSTLAHELGHSMHSYLTWQHQPFIYGDYSLFLAEVASNFNQAMVRSYLLEKVDDPKFQIVLIEEAMANFYRYFLVMPTLARFELEIHERVERGEGVTADDMIGLMSDLFSEAYGEEMILDRQRVGIGWATFGHLYADYYVYAYATGIAAANTLSNRITSGQEGAVDDYLGFLKAGGSDYPLDVLKRAGVDLTKPQPVEETFALLSEMVDRLENLLGMS